MVLGEIKKGTDIGLGYCGKYILHACESCGKERWVRYGGMRHGTGNPSSRVCPECNPARWIKSTLIGSRRKAGKGYNWIYIGENDFFSPMVPPSQKKRGWVLEHRLVISRKLGRCLHDWEVVHHIDGDKTNNSPDNLQLLMEIGHNQITNMERVLRKQERQIKELQSRVTLLEAGQVLLDREKVTGGTSSEYSM